MNTTNTDFLYLFSKKYFKVTFTNHPRNGTKRFQGDDFSSSLTCYFHYSRCSMIDVKVVIGIINCKILQMNKVFCQKSLIMISFQLDSHLLIHQSERVSPIADCGRRKE